MSWNDLTFDLNSMATSEKLTKLQGNFSALAAGDAGAPLIQPAAIDTTKDFTVNKLTVADSLVIPATTRCLSIAPQQAVITSGSFSSTLYDSTGALYCFGLLLTMDYIVAINLPHGAIITEHRGYFYNGHADAVTTAILKKADRAGNLTTLASTWANSAAGYVNSANGAVTDTVDNTTYNYFAVGTITRVGATTYNAAFCGIRITYTIAAPLP